MYNTHPDLDAELDMAVIDDKFSIAKDEEDLMSTPQYKITNFNLYCTKGCCVRLDTNLIEKNKEVWMFGYLKCHIASSARYGYSSFDGGEIALSGCPESPTAEYYLMEPSELYQPLIPQQAEATQRGGPCQYSYQSPGSLRSRR